MKHAALRALYAAVWLLLKHNGLSATTEALRIRRWLEQHDEDSLR